LFQLMMWKKNTRGGAWQAPSSFYCSQCYTKEHKGALHPHPPFSSCYITSAMKNKHKGGCNQKERGKLKEQSLMCMKLLNRARNIGYFIINSITCIVTHCQTKILLKSIDSNRTQFCICSFANLSQLCESHHICHSGHIQLATKYQSISQKN
jgi:hypothetical protein